MSWPQNVAFVLEILAAILIFAGCAAGLAIILQIVRQGGWTRAEPSIVEARWQMVRPWLLVGAGVGLAFGITIFVLRGTGSE